VNHFTAAGEPERAKLFARFVEEFEATYEKHASSENRSRSSSSSSFSRRERSRTGERERLRERERWPIPIPSHPRRPRSLVAPRHVARRLRPPDQALDQPADAERALAALARDDARSPTGNISLRHPARNLPRALEILHAQQFRGVNLTVPHKVLAFDRVAEVDAAARPVGAVNTCAGPTAAGTASTRRLRPRHRRPRNPRPRTRRGAHLLLGAGGAARGAPSNASSAGAPR